MIRLAVLFIIHGSSPYCIMWPDHTHLECNYAELEDCQHDARPQDTCVENPNDVSDMSGETRE